MGTLADRRFEMVAQPRPIRGGSIEGLPRSSLRPAGPCLCRTDPGVRRAGVIAPILDRLAGARITTGIFADVEPNPAAATVEAGRGAARLRP
jgi:alcohol dehydrogenase class IV